MAEPSTPAQADAHAQPANLGTSELNGATDPNADVDMDQDEMSLVGDPRPPSLPQSQPIAPPPQQLEAQQPQVQQQQVQQPEVPQQQTQPSQQLQPAPPPAQPTQPPPQSAPTPPPAAVSTPSQARGSPHPTAASTMPAPPVNPNPHGSPTRVYLNQNVTPHLLEAMKMLVTHEPEKPLKYLAEYLAEKSRELEGA